MSREDHKTLNQDWVQSFNERNWTLESSFRTSDFRAHMSATPAVLDSDGWLGFLRGLTVSFPDVQITITHAIAEKDTVGCRWTMTGTHQGPFMGVPPTGRQMTIEGLDFSRVVDGKVAEHWAQFDAVSAMIQIGALPAPSPEAQAVPA